MIHLSGNSCLSELSTSKMAFKKAFPKLTDNKLLSKNLIENDSSRVELIMSLHTRIGRFSNLAPLRKFRRLKLSKISAAQLGDWMPMFQPLSFPPRALGPSGFRSLASICQSARWALAPNTRGFGRTEYCGIGRGGLFKRFCALPRKKLASNTCI